MHRIIRISHINRYDILRSFFPIPYWIRSGVFITHLILLLVTLMTVNAWETENEELKNSVIGSSASGNEDSKIYSFPLVPTMFLHPVHGVRRELLDAQRRLLREREKQDHYNGHGYDKSSIPLRKFDFYTGTQLISPFLPPINTTSISNNSSSENDNHHLTSLLIKLYEQSEDHDRILQNFERSRRASRFEQQRRLQRNNQAYDHRMNASSYIQSAPLSQGPGTHYATLWIGTPNPQRVTTIVDTGSHLTAFPCEKCPDCGDTHTDEYFDPGKSSSFSYHSCDECPNSIISTCDYQIDKCVYKLSYVEGSSWQAYSSNDRFMFGSNHKSTRLSDINNDNVRFAIDFSFGCQFKVTGLFKDQLADGIMGMDKTKGNIVKAMYREKKIKHDMFSMCFDKAPTYSELGITAGVLTIGGIDERLQNGNPMIYAKTVPSEYFIVNVKGLYLGLPEKNPGGNIQKTPILKVVTNDNVTMNSGNGVVIDSGTTDTYFSYRFEEEFSKLWSESFKYKNAPIRMTSLQYNKLPTVYVHIETSNTEQVPSRDTKFVYGYTGWDISPESPQDVLLAIPPDHYMEPSVLDNTYIPRIYFTESSGGVLGANAMRGYNVLFDMENDRVGFARSDCNYIEKVEILSDVNITSFSSSSPISFIYFSSPERNSKSLPYIVVIILSISLCLIIVALIAFIYFRKSRKNDQTNVTESYPINSDVKRHESEQLIQRHNLSKKM